MNREEIEIMAPVGSWESLYAAIQGGANSVYFGVQGLNMRSASSVNFSLDDLAQIVEICRQRGLKSYLTLNTVLFDRDLEYMREVLDRAKTEGVTAVIVSDQAALNYAYEIGVEIHLSTQLNISNVESVRFYAQFADVVVLARELTLPQVRYIYEQIRERDIRGRRGELVRIEMFVHGALCMATSGKCYLSLHEAWKSANRGECRQICRRRYRVEDIETGAALEVDNEYIMSPKDLCTIEFLEEMIEAGVRVLKIEGRARGGEYVRRVCGSYDRAVREIVDGGYSKESAGELVAGLSEVFNRGFWGGYYLGHRAGGEFGEWTSSYGSSATRRKVYVGKVTNYFGKIGVAEILIEASTVSTGEDIVVLGETTGALEFMVGEMRVDLAVCQQAVQGDKCSIKLGEAVRRGDKVYKMIKVG